MMMTNMGGGQMMVINPNRQESERYSCPFMFEIIRQKGSHASTSTAAYDDPISLKPRERLANATQMRRRNRSTVISVPSRSREGWGPPSPFKTDRDLQTTSDVLRAHEYRCKERGEAPVPEGQSKGRKRSSCQSCVKLRTRCDQETPCGRCVELGKDCVRGRSITISCS